MNSRAMVIGNEGYSLDELVSLLDEAGIETAIVYEESWEPKALSEIGPQIIVVESGNGPDGWDISSEIRRDSNIPIILLGTIDSEMAWVKAAAYGVDCYVERPFSPLELVARIRSLIRRHQNRRDGLADLQTSTA